MTERGRDLLVRGVAAAKAGSKDEARFFLEKYLRQGLPPDAHVQAWRYLADIEDDPAKKKHYIGLILAVDPTDGLARRELALLDGRLDPSAIVNPDAQRPSNASEAIDEADGQRLSCSTCGSARVVFSPDGQSLVCEHCGASQAADFAAGDRGIRDHDFAATMWTAKGRKTAESIAAFTCEGCGVSFLLAPGVSSATCPHCAAVHLVTSADTRELIPPEALIPFAVSRQTARDTLDAFGDEHGIAVEVDTLSPLYVPVWMFSFAGEIRWTGFRRDTVDFQRNRPMPVSGTLTEIDRQSLVCASPAIPEALRPVVDEFDLGALVPYDPRYLADMPAEAYRLTLDEASIEGRRKALAASRESARDELDEVQKLELSFGRLGIDTFKLLLLPVWIAHFTSDDDARRIVIVNGQTGRAEGDVPRRGLLSWMARIWGGT